MSLGGDPGRRVGDYDQNTLYESMKYESMEYEKPVNFIYIKLYIIIYIIYIIYIHIYTYLKRQSLTDVLRA